MLRLFQPRQHHRLDNAIDVLLRELAEDSGGGSGLTDQPFEVSDAFRTQGFYGQRDLNPLLNCFSSRSSLPP